MTTLIGTNPDQIPVNSMLGGMAYQDPDSINVKDFNSSGTANIASLVSPAANITNLSYSGTLTGGTGVINIGSDQIYKDASGNVGLGAVPISNGKTLTLVNASTGNSSFYLQNSTTGFTATDGTLLQLSGSAAYLWNFENSTLSLGTNNTEYVRLTSTGDLLNLGTGATKLQEGTTAQRPASPQEGMIRKNSTLGVIEGYSGGDYVSLEAGRLIARTVFTSDGTFTPNSKTKEMIVELVGGGGGSGGVPTTGASQASLSTAGGFGEYLKAHWPRSVPVAASYNVLIGTGGAGGSAGTNSGLAGGQTRFSDGVGSIAGAKGGYGGAGGVVETVFPVIRKAALAPSDSYVSGSFQEWDKLSPPRPTTIIYNSSGSVMVADLIQPFVHRNDVGVGGDFKVSFASTTQAAGNTGHSGVVIIYEYS